MARIHSEFGQKLEQKEVKYFKEKFTDSEKNNFPSRKFTQISDRNDEQIRFQISTLSLSPKSNSSLKQPLSGAQRTVSQNSIKYADSVAVRVISIFVTIFKYRDRCSNRIRRSRYLVR